MKILNVKHIFLLVCLSISNEVFSSALPENISELVDSSAPAVVNITAKKEEPMRTHLSKRFRCSAKICGSL